MSQPSDSDKPWKGRFTEATDAFVEAFTASVNFDRRLYAHDIEGSIAHARMLTRAGILTEAECDAILKGLEDIRMDIERGDFKWSVQLEDVHMNIEARLTARIGDAGKKLHTGRSPNSTPSSTCLAGCSTACWISPSARPTPSCPASPTYRWPSR